MNFFFLSLFALHPDLFHTQWDNSPLQPRETWSYENTLEEALQLREDFLEISANENYLENASLWHCNQWEGLKPDIEQHYFEKSKTTFSALLSPSTWHKNIFVEHQENTHPNCLNSSHDRQSQWYKHKYEMQQFWDEHTGQHKNFILSVLKKPTKTSNLLYQWINKKVYSSIKTHSAESWFFQNYQGDSKAVIKNQIANFITNIQLHIVNLNEDEKITRFHQIDQIIIEKMNSLPKAGRSSLTTSDSSDLGEGLIQDIQKNEDSFKAIPNHFKSKSLEKEVATHLLENKNFIDLSMSAKDMSKTIKTTAHSVFMELAALNKNKDRIDDDSFLEEYEEIKNKISNFHISKTSPAHNRSHIDTRGWKSEMKSLKKHQESIQKKRHPTYLKKQIQKEKKKQSSWVSKNWKTVFERDIAHRYLEQLSLQNSLSEHQVHENIRAIHQCVQIKSKLITSAIGIIKEFKSGRKRWVIDLIEINKNLKSECVLHAQGKHGPNRANPSLLRKAHLVEKEIESIIFNFHNIASDMTYDPIMINSESSEELPDSKPRSMLDSVQNNFMKIKNKHHTYLNYKKIIHDLSDLNVEITSDVESNAYSACLDGLPHDEVVHAIYSQSKEQDNTSRIEKSENLLLQELSIIDNKTTVLTDEINSKMQEFFTQIKNTQ